MGRKRRIGLMAGILSIVVAGCGGSTSKKLTPETPATDEKPVSENPDKEKTDEDGVAAQDDIIEMNDMTQGVFQQNATDFSIKLFQKSVKESENSMISPASVMLALTMTENGAKGDTLAQMQELLGADLSLEEWNEALSSWQQTLPSSEDAAFRMANSIWIKDEDSLTVEEDFLQKNTQYYDAQVYKALFDESTLGDINKWVEENTDGMIEKIMDKIDKSAKMYLINAVTFDAKWQAEYNAQQVHQAAFTRADGEAQQVDMMYSEEWSYLQDENATGFVKPYMEGYSFVALLPKKGMTEEEYIEGMTGEQVLTCYQNAENCTVETALPKFTAEYNILLNDPLKSLGMLDLFDPDQADLTGLGQSKDGNLYVNRVLHKTYIAVDELGTKAGAVTAVEVSGESATEVEEVKQVYLDRPFVYAIVENETGIPLFLGTVQEIK